MNRIEWERAPLRELFRLSWPIAVSMLSYSVMTLTGTFFVASMGPAALAGVGLGGTAAFLCVVFAFGLLRGVKVLVSQARGAGAVDARARIATGVVVALAIGVAASIAAAGIALVLPFFAATREAGAHASTYLAIRGLSSPLVLVFVALREARYGLGDARTPMIASVTGNLVNVAVDATLILGLGFGVEGAALGTLCAHAVECGILLLSVVRARQLVLRLATWAEVRRLLDVGVPTGLQFVLEMGSFALLTLLLARLGDVELAAHQIALQVIHFSFLPAVAIGEAASVMAGQAIGARRRNLVTSIARQGALVVVAFTGACTAALFFGGDAIARGFTDDGQLAARAASLLLIAALFQVADGVNIVARGVLRGTGDVRTPAIVGIATAWICVPPLTLLLGYVAGLGARGAWIGLTVEILVGAAILWHRLETRRWLFAARRARFAAAAT